MSIEGKEAVVIGRSNIVGIPVSLLLMQARYDVNVTARLSFRLTLRGRFSGVGLSKTLARLRDVWSA